MVDAAGTTKHIYKAGGQLWTEDPPSPRLRRGGRPVGQRYCDELLQQRATEEAAWTATADRRVDQRLHLRRRASAGHGGFPPARSHIPTKARVISARTSPCPTAP